MEDGRGGGGEGGGEGGIWEDFLRGGFGTEIYERNWRLWWYLVAVMVVVVMVVVMVVVFVRMGSWSFGCDFTLAEWMRGELEEEGEGKGGGRFCGCLILKFLLLRLWWFIRYSEISQLRVTWYRQRRRH